MQPKKKNLYAEARAGRGEALAIMWYQILERNPAKKDVADKLEKSHKAAITHIQQAALRKRARVV